MAVYKVAGQGIPLAETQSQLTPLQREVLIAGAEKEAEEKQKAAEDNGAGHSNGVPKQNSMAGSETTESRHYVNTGPDGRDDFDG